MSNKEVDFKTQTKLKKNDVYVACNERQVDHVENMLKSGRRYFGSSGASLTHQISNPIYTEKHKSADDEESVGIDPGLARAGLEGEHRTSRLILEWMKDKPNVVLVDSVHIKGHGKEELNPETGTIEGGDTDHVLIMGDIVIIIDSKNWKGRRKYSINDKGEVIRGKTTFPGGKITTVQAGRLWANALRQHRITVSSIVNISTEKVFVVRDRNWWKQPYRLVTLEILEAFLSEVWENISPRSRDHINVNLVTSIVASAIKPYDVFKEELGEIADLLDV